jgi:hypothetical protein
MGPTLLRTHKKLEAVQKRSARFVMNNYQQTSSVTSMLQTLQWPTLAERRARIKATMMYRIVNGLVAIPPTELHTSTTTARFIVLYARMQLYRHSFFPDTIRIWNGLPQPLVESTSLETFKQGGAQLSHPIIAHHVFRLLIKHLYIFFFFFFFAPLLSQPAWASAIFLYPEICTLLEEEEENKAK